MNIDSIVENQKLFFHSKATRNISFIKQQLEKLKKEIVRKEKSIYEALYADLKKSNFETYLCEIGFVTAEIDRTLKNLEQWTKPKRVRASILNFPSKDYIYSEPYGNTLVISPWNYPFQLSFAPAIAAIAAGNTVLLKPSEHTPNTSKLIHDLVKNVFEAGHFAVVEGGVSVSTDLLNKKWDYVFFTGSVEVGKIVAQKTAKYLTPTTLELGGKNPCIIDDSVNTKLVAKRIVWGKFINAGQTCIAPDYLLVHSAIKKQLILDIKNEIIAAYGVNPENSLDYTRIINKKHLRRLKLMLEGSEIIFGGKVNEKDCYLSPTLIDEPNPDSKVMKTEIFGPILPIISYDDEEKIKDILHRHEKPLSLYVFSNNTKKSKYYVNNFSFGGGCINDTIIQFGNHRLPFGGVGESGIGAYHGKFGFDTFSHKKSIVFKANWLDIPLRYAPFNNKLKLLKKLLHRLI